MPSLHPASEDNHLCLSGNGVLKRGSSTWSIEKGPSNQTAKIAIEPQLAQWTRPVNLSSRILSMSMKRKAVRSLPTPETSPERPSQKRQIANRASEANVFAYLTPPPSDEGDVCSNETFTSDSDDSVEFPLSPRPLPDLHMSIGTTTPLNQNQVTRRKGMVSGDLRVTPKPSNDRFISNRVSAYDLPHTFRSTKATHDLSKPEKMLRDSSATPDPFGRLILPRVREQSTASSRNRRRLTRSDRARSRTVGTFNTISLPQDRSAPQNRQVSAGAVWSVGRSSPAVQIGPVRAISDGRGRFLSSGSNAPLYMAEFLDERTQDQEIETMENRIARALDIDQTERLISTVRTFREPRSASTGSIGLQRKQSSEHSKTTWSNGQWVRSCSSRTWPPFWTI